MNYNGVRFEGLGILPSLDASVVGNTNILYFLLCFPLISFRINFVSICVKMEFMIHASILEGVHGK